MSDQGREETARFTRVWTDGSDPLDAVALLLGKPKEDLEHLRKFDDLDKAEKLEKIDKEIARLARKRKAAAK